MTRHALLAGAIAALAALPAASETAPKDVAFAEGAVATSLSGVAGDPESGAKIMTTNAKGNCVACHLIEAMPNVQRLIGDKAVFAEKMYSALEGADFLVIATEWPEFRTPQFDRIAASLSEKVIFDGRNLYELDTLAKHGFAYYSIGRSEIN